MISVIVPVLNEAGLLSHTLERVKANAFPHEIIVVDGGSTDDSLVMAQRVAVQVLLSPIQQRAAQMNQGAEAAQGDILLFLHADTLLHADALEAIAAKLAAPDAVGGAFARRFDHPSWFLKFSAYIGDLRSIFLKGYLGDQAMFVKTALFRYLNGFRLLDCYEDLDLSLRLRRLGKTFLLRPPIVSSGRRFESQPVRRMLADARVITRLLIKSRNRTVELDEIR